MYYIQVERNNYLRGRFYIEWWRRIFCYGNRAFMIYLITFFGLSKDVEFLNLSRCGPFVDTCTATKMLSTDPTEWSFSGKFCVNLELKLLLQNKCNCSVYLEEKCLSVWLTQTIRQSGQLGSLFEFKYMVLKSDFFFSRLNSTEDKKKFGLMYAAFTKVCKYTQIQTDTYIFQIFCR